MPNKDNINKEYEARVVVSEDQYLEIRQFYLNSKKPVKELTNVNYYFDTEDRKLTHSGAVLRVRKINDKEYELTLKIKEENYDVEYNHPLTYDELKSLEAKFDINYKEILNGLKSKGVSPHSLKMIAELKTERLEIQEEKYLLVIDKNYYNGKVDFNIEVESDSKKAAKRHLINIISQFGIEYKEGYISKSRRAILGL